MKILQFLPILLLFSATSFGQVLDDLNSSFIKDLINNGVDTNNDGLIQRSEALATDSLRLDTYSGLTGVDGLEHFKNLTYLAVTTGAIETLDVSEFKKLEELYTGMWSVEYLVADGLENLKILGTDFGVDSISLNGTENLERLSTQDNFGVIPILDYSKLTKLKNLYHFGLPIGYTLNLDPLVNLETFDLTFFSTPIFENLTIKNGRHTDIKIFRYTSSSNDAFRYICTDDDEVDYVKGVLQEIDFGDVEVNTYCTFENGGEAKYISGTNHVDLDGDGCDEDDPIMPNLKFEFTDLSNGKSGIFASSDGTYKVREGSGSYRIRPILDNADYFSITPEMQEITITDIESDAFLDFCLGAVGDKTDVSVGLFPVRRARPGFTATYVLSYHNNGNASSSGEISLKFDNDYMKFLDSDVEAESLDHGEMIWRFDDLIPNETSKIKIAFEFNKPTDEEFPLVGGEQLNFDVNISPEVNDVNIEDNEFNLEQLVVNSYDPNDITCLEGDSITFLETGEFVHYMVRFENTGTAEAVNIVVKDTINTDKFDINTLVPVEGSHNHTTKISDEGIVEFIFENINLPHTEEERHGYVVFKLKTKESLVEGDQFKNSAAIYFDFNFPIFTNKFETEVVGIAAALPVKLSSFDARQSEENVKLNWEVQSEENLSHYIVERRYEGEEDFSSIARINSANLTDYSSVDKEINKYGIYYYRLKMVDNDGQSEWSDVIAIDFSKLSIELVNVYPNPASEILNIENNQSENLNVTIYNASGQEVLRANLIGNSKEKFDVANFSNGLHFVSFYSEGKVEVKKVFIDR